MVTKTKNATVKNITRKTLLVNKQHPSWGTWRVLKLPTKKSNWFEIKGDSGDRVLFKSEVKYWSVIIK